MNYHLGAGMSELADVLQTYGGWGVSVVCLFVIRQMAAYVKKLHNQQHVQAKAAAETQREETRATVTAIVETRDALRTTKDAMDALARKLEE